ncbi:MAG: 2-phosphosulfolactate phosphatase, partial [bacterium]
VESRGPVLVGALRNATAAGREAARIARTLDDAGITIVCAGREGAFGIDDAYTAGCLVDLLQAEGDGEMTDGALAALRLFRSEPDAAALFRRSAAGRNVAALGLADDVTYCAQRDRSTAVPTLGRDLQLLSADG